MFHLLSGCCGFIMAQTGIFGNYSPFGIAFAAALPGEYILSGAVGAGAGYILTKDMDMPLRYIAALTIVTITAYAVRKSRKPSLNENNFPPVATGISVTNSSVSSSERTPT